MGSHAMRNGYEDDLKALDDEIERQRKALRDLRGHRNQFIPISRLPSTTLADVFHISCAQEEAETDAIWDAIVDQRFWFGDWHKRYNGARRAIQLSHVCSRWRTVARGDALLWANLLMSSEKWCVRMLARSRAAPLCVRMSLPTDQETQRKAATLVHLRSARRALAHMARIQDLTIACSPGRITDSILRLLSSPAPSVRTFRLANQAANIPGTAPPAPMLPDDMFGGAAVLSRLSVAGYGINWTSSLLRGHDLTHLELARLEKWKAAPLSNLLTLLSHIPKLHTLSLREAIPSRELSTGPVVELPNLAKLSLSDDLNDSMNLLQRITGIPSSCAVHIQATRTSHRSILRELTHSLLRTVAPFCRDSRTVHLAGYNTFEAYYTQVTCWPTMIRDSAVISQTNLPGSKFKVSISFQGPSGGSGLGHMPQLTADIATILSLGDAQTFSYEGVDHDDYHLDAWPPVFSLLPKIEYFRVNSQMLAILLNVSLAEPDPFAVLPRLHTLMFEGVVLTASIFDKLQRFLAGRAGAIRLITIANSALRSTDVAELRRLVNVEMPNRDRTRVPGFVDLFGEDAVGNMEFDDPHLLYAHVTQADVDYSTLRTPFDDGDIDL